MDPNAPILDVAEKTEASSSESSASPILAARNGINKPEKKTPVIIEKMKVFFSKKNNVIIVAVSLVVIIAGIVTLLLNKEEEIEQAKKAESEKTGTSKKSVKKHYDNLTGELLVYSGTQYNADGSVKENEDGNPIVYSDLQAEQYAVHSNQSRISCVQISNDIGARPQVGLGGARIIYEMPAENGATSFSAMYRDSSLDVIGPITLLMSYNYDFETPFDCTNIFDGNGDNSALSSAKKFSRFSETNGSMWRDKSAYLEPYNLFTSSKKISEYNRDNKLERSELKPFSRMTPEDTSSELKKIRKAQSEGDNSKYTFASNINVSFGGIPQYNVKYTYNPSTNSYLRSYESGEPHVSYTCKKLKQSEDKIKPTQDCGQAAQLSPKVVVVIDTDTDNAQGGYTVSVKSTGSGEAWIFQNGIVLKGTWERKSGEQLAFKNEKGEEIKLAPGQTFISVITEANVIYTEN